MQSRAKVDIAVSLSTHVLDMVTGQPAAAVPVTLLRLDGGAWATVASGNTDADGRLSGWVPAAQWRVGRYELCFDVRAYHGAEAFFPEIRITFEISDPLQRLHLPLLLSRYGYTTYRGS